ncbi:MAG: MFS transporter [Thermomicrobiales bacterium]
MAAVREAADEPGSLAEIVGDRPSITAASPTARSRVLPFAIALLSLALIYWTIDIVSPALPSIKDDLALSASGAGLVFSLFFAGRLVGNFPAAFLVDRVGAPATAMIGAALLAAGSALAASAPSAAVLYPARMLQGVAVALLVTAALISLVRLRPGQGAAMTYFGFMATIGGIFGLASGGLLTGTTGWRGIFVLSIGLAGALAVAGAWSRRTPTTAAPIAATSTADEDAARDGRFRAIAVFVLANFLAYFNYAVWTALPLYADKAFDASPGTISALLLSVTLVHLVAAFPCGRVIARWGGRRALLAGVVVSLTGTALLLAPGEALWLALPLAPFSIGQVLATNAAGDLVLHGAGRGGRAVGMVRLSSDFGLVVGPAVAGVLQDVAGYGAPFAVLPVISAVAAVALWRATAVSYSAPVAPGGAHHG